MELLNEMEKCNACELSKVPVVPRLIKVPVKLMFVGENPARDSDINEPLSTKRRSGKALEEYYLKPLGLSREEVWITNLIKCTYPKDENNTKKLGDQAAAICAKKWLIKEVEYASPFIIVTLSKEEVYNRAKKIFGWEELPDFKTAAGRPYQVQMNGHSFTLFPMVHPDITGDNKRKSNSAEKWAPLHRDDHIPELKKLLEGFDNHNL